MIDVIIGKKRFLINQKTHEILDGYRETFGEFEIQEFDSESSSFNIYEFIEACSTVSLFSDKSAVILKADKIKKDDELKITEILDKVPYELLLILQFTKKPLAKTPLGKALKKLKIHTIKKQTSKELSSLLKKEIKKRKIDINHSAFQELHFRLKSNPEQIDQELDKLEVLDEPITVPLISQLIHLPLDDNVFNLSNAVLDKKSKVAFKIYNDLLENKMEPLSLMGLLASGLRRIFQISVLADQGYSAQKISRDLNLSEKQVFFLIRNQLRPYHQVLKLLNDLANIDQKIKLGQVDPYVAFEMWMIDASK